MADAEGSAERFRRLDPYRVAREWQRYEGTAQRDLFRELRRRFLRRHAEAAGPIADVGSGPGRFSDDIGPSDAPRVLVDLSDEALREARGRDRAVRRSRGPWHYVRGDARAPPLRPGRFGTVVLFGNVLGFAGPDGERVLDHCLSLAAPDGVVLIESVAGPGERSRYLGRLPPGAVRRAMRAPPSWLGRRIGVEGFAREPPRKRSESESFLRWGPEELREALLRRSFAVREILAVAPLLGADPLRAEAVRQDPESWDRLLALEEQLGAAPPRVRAAAAFLVAAVRSEAPGEVQSGPAAPVARDGSPRRAKRGIK